MLGSHLPSSSGSSSPISNSASVMFFLLKRCLSLACPLFVVGFGRSLNKIDHNGPRDLSKQPIEIKNDHKTPKPETEKIENTLNIIINGKHRKHWKALTSPRATGSLALLSPLQASLSPVLPWPGRGGRVDPPPTATMDPPYSRRP